MVLRRGLLPSQRCRYSTAEFASDKTADEARGAAAETGTSDCAAAGDREANASTAALHPVRAETHAAGRRAKITFETMLISKPTNES
jgi:hypothetical protein